MAVVIKNKVLCVFVILSALLVIIGSYPRKATASEGPEWPPQNITIIVAYNPGGGFDLVARLTAPFIEKYLPRRVSVIMKNVTGGAGRIGTREWVKSKPDGLTIGIFDPVTLAVMEVGGKLEWLDTRKVSWLAQLDNLPDMLVVGPKTGFKHPKDMKGKTVRFAAQEDATIFRSGVVARSLGVTPLFVHYAGTGEAIMASMRGDLDALSLSWSSGLRQVKATEGKMIPLFVSSKVPGLNVPTAQEFGIEVDEMIMNHPHILAGPPGLAPEIRRMWEETFSKVFKDADWSAKMDKLGYPASPLLGKDKLDAMVAAIMGRMDKYKDLFSSLSLK